MPREIIRFLKENGRGYGSLSNKGAASGEQGFKLRADGDGVGATADRGGEAAGG